MRENGSVVTGGAQISEREQEVLAGLAEHLTNAQIAQRLHISVRTVESHVSSLLRKLGAADRRALARLGAELASPAEGVPAAAGTLHGAPASLTSFVGRHAELEALSVALAESRLVNLVGPGGVGKTRLVVEAGRAAAPTFPSGAWFIDLVPVRSGAVASTIAAVLDVVERPNLSIEDGIEDALRERRTLLVLDNCEHVLEPVAALLERLLVSCPELRIVASSRELLGVAGERVVPVGELDEADAVALFVDRARSLDPSFDGAGDEAALEEICRRLDGMPLAIELASARCAVIGLDGVRAGLDDRLRLLSGARRTDHRHRSMRDVLDWSHELLAEDEQIVFRRLAAFAGDFTSAEAVAVAGIGIDGTAVEDAVAQLTAKSLLVRRRDDSVTRYRLLETVRDYAIERLEASGEADAVHLRHLTWIAGECAASEAALVAGREWRFGALAADARTALHWALEQANPPADAHELARAFAHLAYAKRQLSEAHAWYDRAAALTTDDCAAAEDLRSGACVAYARMRADLSFTALIEAAERAERGGDRRLASICLSEASAYAGRCPAEFPRVPAGDELRALVSRARALLPDDDPVAHGHLLVAEAWQGSDFPAWADLDKARRAVAAVRELGDLPLLSIALDAETAGMWDIGRFADAQRLANQRFELVDQLDRHDPRTGGELIDIFHMVADTAVAAGDLFAALDAAALMGKDEMGQTAPHAVLRPAVIALVLLGRFREAIEEADGMRREWERAGRPSAAWMMAAAAATQLAHGILGDEAAAIEWGEVTHATGGLEGPRPGNRGFMAFTSGRLALHQGRLDDARSAIAAWDPSYPGPHFAYSTALAAEIAVIAKAPDAPEQLDAARARVELNPWAAACLLRAEARLQSDGALLRAALDAFDEIGARFEWAVTAMLLDGAVADEGRALLEELGATLPVEV
jgi:predicted ATPase/DNA-binding CsgD family transcriptional regulator